jgi:hypothetical protein
MGAPASSFAQPGLRGETSESLIPTATLSCERRVHIATRGCVADLSKMDRERILYPFDRNRLETPR